jgi:hypothetical protein
LYFSSNMGSISASNYSRGVLVHSRSYLKNAEYVQGQEAHLYQYNQMCYPAHAGARTDPPSLKKLWRDRRKSAAYMGVCEHFEEVSNTVIGR